MVNARITGSSSNYRFTTESNTFDTAIATVENATGLPLTVGLAGLDADDRQVTVEIKSTNSNGPKTLVALDDTVVAVKVFIDASFTAGGAVQGTWLDTFPVTPTYRQLEATVTNEAVQTSGPSQLYLSTSGTVEITNGGTPTTTASTCWPTRRS